MLITIEKLNSINHSYLWKGLNKIFFILCIFFPLASYAVYDGTVIDTDLSSSTAKIVQKSEVVCSGTLIRDNLILTAKHCFDSLLKNQEIHKQNKRTPSGAWVTIFKYAYLLGSKSDFMDENIIYAQFRVKCKDGSYEEPKMHVMPKVIFLPLPEVTTEFNGETDIAIMQIDPVKTTSACQGRPKIATLSTANPFSTLLQSEYLIGWGWKGNSSVKSNLRRGGLNEYILYCSEKVGNLCSKFSHPMCAGDAGGSSYLIPNTTKVPTETAGLSGVIIGVTEKTQEKTYFNFTNNLQNNCLPSKNSATLSVSIYPHLKWLKNMLYILPE